jgi:type VI secretion system protein ImpF
MQRFAPYLLDRLIDVSPNDAMRPMLSLEQLKDSVARDVEALLNTRRGLDADDAAGFPRVRRSVVGFGLDDFASRSMASTNDQAVVCRAIERAVLDHEPRLRNVRVELRRGDASRQSLKFAIRAMLHVHPMQAPVNFDAVLQTSTQQYAVAAAKRSAPEVAE